MTEEQQVALAIKRLIASLPPDKIQTVSICLDQLRKMIAEHGEEAQLALMYMAAELAAGVTG